MLKINAFERLVEELRKLPGIGRKSAHRIVFHLLNQSGDRVLKLSDALVNLKKNIVFCSRCFNLSEDRLCWVCDDPDRSAAVCVVETVQDLIAIERTGDFSGRYHVLGGVISPLEGIGPEELRIRELLARFENETIEEVILATNFTVEGEATAMYIAKLLKKNAVRVFRIAYGLPVGGSLEYADEATMSKALEGRREM